MNVHNCSKILPILFLHQFHVKLPISFFKFVKQNWKGCITPKFPHKVSLLYKNFFIMSSSIFFIFLEEQLQKAMVFKYLAIFKNICG